MTKEIIEAIEEQLDENDVDELILENITINKITDDIKKKLEAIPSLISLSLNSCKLHSLANFPHLKKLIRLEIMTNNLCGSEFKHLEHLHALESLSAGENKIEKFEDLKPLTSLKNLIQLDLSDTPLSKEPDYRKKVFDMLTNLQILDNRDAENKTYEYSSDGQEDEGEDEFDNDGGPYEDQDDDDGEEDEEGEEIEDDEEIQDDDDEGDDGEDDDDEEDEDEDSDEDNKKKQKNIAANTKKSKK